MLTKTHISRLAKWDLVFGVAASKACLDVSVVQGLRCQQIDIQHLFSMLAYDQMRGLQIRWQS